SMLPVAQSLGSSDAVTLRPGAIRPRTPVGSSKSNAPSGEQNSPACAPKGLIFTSLARVTDELKTGSSKTTKLANHLRFIILPSLLRLIIFDPYLAEDPFVPRL